MGEAPSVTNFGERWPLVYFGLPSRYFGLLGGGEIGSGAERSQFVEGRHLSPIPGEGGLQPIMCCQPARSHEGCFLAVSPGLFFWLCRQGYFLAVSPGLFSGCVARVVFWLCRQGCFLAVSPGLFSGCVARVASDCVARFVL